MLTTLLFYAALAVGSSTVVDPGIMEAHRKEAVKIHRYLQWKFTPVEQRTDSWKWHTGRQRFEGDCDDYAMAVYWQMKSKGLAPYFFVAKAKRSRYEGRYHALTCHVGEGADVWCSDSAYPRGISTWAQTLKRYEVVSYVAFKDLERLAGPMPTKRRKN